MAVDYDHRIVGIDANTPDAPWNVFACEGAEHALKGVREIRSYDGTVPEEIWRDRDATPIYHGGLIRDLCDLLVRRARIGIFGAPQSGKSTLQEALHASLPSPLASILIHPSTLRSSVGDTNVLTFEQLGTAQELPPASVFSVNEILECGHIFRLFHGAQTICSRHRAEALARMWATGIGGTYTVPDPALTVGLALFNLRQCFPEIADMTTHIVMASREGREGHRYTVYEQPPV